MIRNFLTSMLLFFSIQVLAEELYTVKSIKISANNKNASIARNEAIEQGQIKGFHILVKQHFPTAVDIVSTLTDSDIFNTVSGFELSNERRSSTNYYARINVKFSKSQIDKLMKNLGANFKKDEVHINTSESTSLLKHEEANVAIISPTLVSLIVPVYENEGKTYWLEEDNPWYNFLQGKLKGMLSNNSKFTLPVEDIEDLEVINKHILNKNSFDLANIMEKYGVNCIIVARLVNITHTEPEIDLALKVNYISKFNTIWSEHNFTTLQGENLTKLMELTFNELDKFNFALKKETLIHSFSLMSSRNLDAEVNIDSISNWVELEKIMSDSQYFSNIKIHSMNLKKYMISFDYKISYLDLKDFFKAHKYELNETENNKYLIARISENEEF